MKGTRPLTNSEITQVVNSLSSLRDRTLFIVGVRTGFRISELLSIKVKDVMQYGKVADRVSVKKSSMKKQIESRSVVLHEEAKQFITQLITEYELDTESYLFPSGKGVNKPLSRFQAWRVLNHAFTVNSLTGSLGTHSMRKSYAQRVYAALDKDLVRTQRALGHKNINSTVSYISFDQNEIDEAIKGIK